MKNTATECFLSKIRWAEWQETGHSLGFAVRSPQRLGLKTTYCPAA